MENSNQLNKSCLTLEVYKKDKRIKSRSRSVRWGKNKPGLRFVEKVDYTDKPKTQVRIIAEMQYPVDKGYVVEVHDTYVTRFNIMSGKEYQERYDLPHFCSPSSETYWSM